MLTVTALCWPLHQAAAQSEAEKARVESLLGDEAAAAGKIRAYDRLHQALADMAGKRAGLFGKEGNKEGSKKEIERANAELLLARQAYESALQRYPGQAVLHNYYGELLFDRFDEQEKGVAEWRKAIELDPRQSRAFNNLGIYLCHQGQYVDGLDNLDKALLLEPENPDYLYNIAQIYLAHWAKIMSIKKWTADELFKAAMKASEASARFAPTEYDLVSDYALNFFVAEQLGVTPDWEAAASAWGAARKLARNPEEEFNTWLNEGRVWYRADKPDKTEKCCDEALKIRPGSMVAEELKNIAREPKTTRKSPAK